MLVESRGLLFSSAGSSERASRGEGARRKVPSHLARSKISFGRRRKKDARVCTYIYIYITYHERRITPYSMHVARMQVYLEKGAVGQYMRFL